MENQEEKRVEFEDVNKFVEGWYPSILFSSFDIRVFPTFQNDIISRMEQISVIRRKLTKKLGEEDIDWFIAETYATKNMVKLASTLFNEGLNLAAIARQLSVSSTTIMRWLRKATQIGWCDYHSKLHKN